MQPARPRNAGGEVRLEAGGGAGELLDDEGVVSQGSDESSVLCPALSRQRRREQRQEQREERESVTVVIG